MGRRRLWIIVGTVLALAGVLAITLRRPQTPFRFLDGREQIRVLPVPEPLTVSSWKIPLDGVGYTWRGNRETVMRAASSEVATHGFVRDYDLGFLRKAPAGHDRIWVFEDTRLLRRATAYGDWTEPAEGWVTVIVDIKGPASLWERIKAVFGL